MCTHSIDDLLPHAPLHCSYCGDGQGFIENKPEDYSQDWRGLIELLDDVDLKALAEKVKHALQLHVHVYNLLFLIHLWVFIHYCRAITKINSSYPARMRKG